MSDLQSLARYDSKKMAGGGSSDIYQQARSAANLKNNSSTNLKDISKEVKAIFEGVDTDKSGFIDAVELRRLLKQWNITNIDHNSLVETFMKGSPKQRGNKYILNLPEFNDFMQFFFSVRAAFEDYAKVKGTGNHMKLNDLQEFLKKFDYTFDRDIMSKFLDIFDADKSGTFEFSEILGLFLYLNRLEFYYIDEDRDGNHSLDEKELQSLLRSLRIHVSTEEMKCILEQIPHEKVSNLNFDNFVGLLFFIKDRIPDVKSQAAVKRQGNKNKPYKRKNVTKDERIVQQIKDAYSREMPKINAILDQCRRSGKKWEDPDFPATSKSLFPKEDHRSKEIGRWMRPEHIAPNPALFVDGVDEGDVIQGSLGDCYLLSSFCVLAAAGNDAIEKLFVASYPEQGVYVCRFYKDGEWRIVCVDDRIPVNKQGGVHYSRCKDPNEMWVSILEKAYAKCHGNFGAIEHGQISDALNDLTGEPTEIQTSLEETDELWERLVEYMEEGYLMGCAAENDEWEDMLQPTDMGILVNHAYGILQVAEVDGHRLMRIRNPWGSHEWTGAWSDGSIEWTPELLDYFQFSFGDDGTFFMEFFDWCEQFTRVVTVRMMNRKWDKMFFKGEWKGPNNAGGCINFPTWMKNPQFKILCSNKTKVFIGLSQTDGRMANSDPKYDYPSHGITIIRRGNNESTLQESMNSRQEIHAVSQFIKTREASVHFNADPGQPYTVLISTFDPNVEVKWYCSICTLGNAEVVQLSNKVPSSSVKGEWAGTLASGCPDWNSWRDGQQYLVDITEPGEKTLTIVQARRQGELCHIGYHVFPCPPERLPQLDKDKAVHQCKYTNGSTVSSTFKFDRGLYTILPATLRPNFDNRWGLVIQGRGSEIRPFDSQWNRSIVSGAWTQELSGGCHNNNNRDYMKNPIVYFRLNSNQTVNFVLQVDHNSPINGIGFYLFEADASKTLTRRMDRSDFKTEKEVMKRFEIPAGHYGIMPVTYTKGVTGPWQLYCYSTNNVQLELLK